MTSIPTQDLMVAAAAAFRAADQHVGLCDTCRIDTRLPELCPLGQRLTFDAVTAMEPSEAATLDPLPPTAVAEFEHGVREQVHAELLYWADRMECGRPEQADVRRDAHYVRQAALLARHGVAERLAPWVLDQSTTHHMDEISRLRARLDDEVTLRDVAEGWADILAYRVAPAEVLGQHGTGGAYPWDSARALITPAADVAELRATLIAYQSGQVPSDCCTSWTAERAADIRALVVSLADGDEYGTRTPMPEPVETAAAIDAAMALQLRVDCLERQVRDLKREASATAPAADLNQCPQNRIGTFLRLTDPLVLGPHSYIADGVRVPRCLFCDAAAWGRDAEPKPTVPTYVYNSRSVNRTTKHMVDPQDHAVTLCTPSFVASEPICPDHAALLALCGGCRRAATGETE